MKINLKLSQKTQEIEILEEKVPVTPITVQESAQQWLVLQQAFEGQLIETEALFAEDRRKALVDLQRRLDQLAVWQTKNG